MLVRKKEIPPKYVFKIQKIDLKLNFYAIYKCKICTIIKSSKGNKKHQKQSFRAKIKIKTNKKIDDRYLGGFYDDYFYT